MNRSRGKPTAAASWIAVGFMIPQPQISVQSGRSWRPMRSQIERCSAPGGVTGYDEMSVS